MSSNGSDKSGSNSSKSNSSNSRSRNNIRKSSESSKSSKSSLNSSQESRSDNSNDENKVEQEQATDEAVVEKQVDDLDQKKIEKKVIVLIPDDFEDSSSDKDGENQEDFNQQHKEENFDNNIIENINVECNQPIVSSDSFKDAQEVKIHTHKNEAVSQDSDKEDENIEIKDSDKLSNQSQDREDDNIEFNVINGVSNKPNTEISSSQDLFSENKNEGNINNCDNSQINDSSVEEN